MHLILVLFQAFGYLLLISVCGSHGILNETLTIGKISPYTVISIGRAKKTKSSSSNDLAPLPPDLFFKKVGGPVPMQEYTESNIQSTFCLIGFITFASFILFVLHPLLTFPKRKRLSQGPPPPPPHYRKFPPPKWTTTTTYKKVKVPIVQHVIDSPSSGWAPGTGYTTSNIQDDDDLSSYSSYSGGGSSSIGSSPGSGWEIDIDSSTDGSDYYSSTKKTPGKTVVTRPRIKGTLPRKPITGYSTIYKQGPSKGGGGNKGKEINEDTIISGNTKSVSSGQSSTTSKEIGDDKLTKEEIMYILKTLED